MNYDGGTEVQDYHVEVASGYVTPDSYMEVLWEDANDFYVALATDPSVGNSHDIFYILPDEIFFNPDPWPANFATEVFVGPPVPVLLTTWGAVRAMYR